jgi:hypothetical protein
MWQAAARVLEGLAGDCAAEAISAAWRDDVLEVLLPAQATTAAAFLRRPEVSASISRALEDLAGRRVSHAVAFAAAASAAGPAAGEEPPRPVAVASHAALMREATEHPLVAHARTVFDAAIRKVEPARPRDLKPATPSSTAALVGEVDESADERSPEAGRENDDG